MPLTLPPSRATIEDLGIVLQITIPNPPRWAAVLLDVLLLAICAGGVCLWLTEPSFTGLALLWLLFWVFLSGVLAAYNLLVELAGRENITVSSDAIVLRYTILGLGRAWEYTLPLINYLRLDWTRGQPLDPPRRSRDRLWDWWWGQQWRYQGWLAFDYDIYTPHFAGGVNQFEARYVLETILNHFPVYRRIAAKEATS